MALPAPALFRMCCPRRLAVGYMHHRSTREKESKKGKGKEGARVRRTKRTRKSEPQSVETAWRKKGETRGKESINFSPSGRAHAILRSRQKKQLSVCRFVFTTLESDASLKLYFFNGGGALEGSLGQRNEEGRDRKGESGLAMVFETGAYEERRHKDWDSERRRPKTHQDPSTGWGKIGDAVDTLDIREFEELVDGHTEKIGAENF
ncbi:hypothetical protein B0H11DRAFT_2182182 [Mycena galericulata]|nr:hypothetical protein B0H11DRAFT_2182182 [Mycena galericulata]